MNTGDDINLRLCKEYLANSTVPTNIIVADNAGNRMGGFAKAHNANLKRGHAEFVLILNPDVFVIPRCIEFALNDLRPQIGIVGAHFDTQAIWLMPDWTGAVRPSGLDPNISQVIPQVMGAFMLMRRTTWEQLGGFDERFLPLYYEDLDLCLRTRLLGYLLWHCASARATHIGCATTDRMKFRRRWWHAKNRLKMLWKWRVECAYS